MFVHPGDIQQASHSRGRSDLDTWNDKADATTLTEIAIRFPASLAYFSEGGHEQAHPIQKTNMEICIYIYT